MQINHLSYSSITRYQRCQLSFKYQYIDKIKTQINGELVRGSAYHEAVASCLLIKHLYGELPPMSAAHETYLNTWSKSVSRTIMVNDGNGTLKEVPAVDFQDKDPEAMFNAGLMLLDIYYNDYMTKIRPLAIEKKAVLNLNGIPLIGYIDLIDQDGCIYDHKTTTRPWPDGREHDDIQPTMYGLLLGGNNIEFHFHQAIAVQKPYIKDVVTKRTKSDYDKLSNTINGVWQQIQSGIFVPGQQGWWCSERYCGHYKLCHSTQQPKIEMPEDF